MVYQALHHFEKQDFLKIIREESATADDIVHTLANFPNKIAIFHFAGHADGVSLHLEDMAGQVKGLANLLGEQENLKLVFLNGCATLQQVQVLFAAGVKAVIATSVPVGDKTATIFASAFYQALANKRTIKRAFLFAKDAVELKQAQEITIRGLHLRKHKKEASFPWGLYINETEEPLALSWQIPHYRKMELSKGMIKAFNDFTANRYLLYVLNEMCGYNPDIYHQMEEVREGKVVKKDSRAFMGIIIQNFPWYIGAQIGLLAQPEHRRMDIKRLACLISTYTFTSQMLYFFLLSNFWDEHKRLKIKAAQSVLGGLNFTKETFSSVDYLQHFLKIYQLLLHSEAQLFIAEIEALAYKLQDQTSNTYKAWQFFERTRRQYLTDHQPTDFNKTLVLAEQALAVLLRDIAFMVNYEMVTVRDISINKSRTAQETFELDIGRLHAADTIGLDMEKDAANRKKATYTHSNAVILVRKNSNFREFLDLSPFVIDKNTHLSRYSSKFQIPDLYVYGYETDEVYHYLSIRHTIFQAIKETAKTDIIHTNLTLGDFEEGHNINDLQDGLNAEFDFDGFTDMLSEGRNESEDSPVVFHLLSTQFEQLKNDLSA